MANTHVKKELAALEESEAELLRLLAKIREFKKQLKDYKSDYILSPSRKRSAVKRTSLDVSENLSNLRKKLTPYQ